MTVEEMTGGCHCKALRFRVRLTDGLNTARRCNCSFCAMRGAIAVSAKLDDMVIERGIDALTRYQFNTGIAEHYFCSHCGIYTHHKRRSDPNEYGINVACLDGASPFDFDEVIVNEGRVHPADRKDRPGANAIAGILRYDIRQGEEE